MKHAARNCGFPGQHITNGQEEKRAIVSRRMNVLQHLPRKFILRIQIKDTVGLETIWKNATKYRSVTSGC